MLFGNIPLNDTPRRPKILQGKLISLRRISQSARVKVDEEKLPNSWGGSSLGRGYNEPMHDSCAIDYFLILSWCSMIQAYLSIVASQFVI